MCSPSASFIFSAFVVSVLTSKLVHFWAYAHAIPLLSFILYLPTFFVLDFIAVCAVRLLLRREKTVISLIGLTVGCLFSVVAVGAAASQLGFYIKTGGELDWRDTKDFATSKDGLVVLLTGSWAVLASACVILLVAWLSQNLWYKPVGAFVTGVGDRIVSVFRVTRSLTRTLIRTLIRNFPPRQRFTKLDTEADIDSDSDSDSDDSLDTDSDSDGDESETEVLVVEAKLPFSNRAITRRCVVPYRPWLVKAAVIVYIIIGFIVRPHVPYDHISNTLVVSVTEIFRQEADYCALQRSIGKNKWPLPKLLRKSHWEEAQGFFKGWAPGASSALAQQYRNQTVDWLPSALPRGFFRWDPERFTNGPLGSWKTSEKPEKWCPRLQEPFYNPVNDPLKITNLDTDVLQPLKEALDGGSVKIKNVVFILMESLRQDLFPIEQGSHIHKRILQSNDEDDEERINGLLSQLTPNIEKITGRRGNFTDANGLPFKTPKLNWNDQTQPGFGGVNVVGAFPAASMSTKSFAADHCGAYPMPVEMFDESETDSYQPCLPQVLGLFNELKDTEHPADFRGQDWYPALFESVTERYDRQDKFDAKIGFKHIIGKDELEEDSRFNRSSPTYKKVNYFGYAEPTLQPYIKSYIANATAHDQRIFMSHFTGTTHHAWDTPDWFETVDYLPTSGTDKWHGNFNKYLNTIRFHDWWMGELMQLLDDTGIANETLVVFAGDHGMVFKEDYPTTGTYEVPHISNFRVPITFRHPHLPQVQYDAKASTISILPTILDLLIESGSLDHNDTRAASELVQEYEGQSLIRPYKTTHEGRRSWTFTVVNNGAGMLSVTSADVPWRLVMPLGKVFEYRLTDLNTDPLEQEPIMEWSLSAFLKAVNHNMGAEAAKWATEAELVAKWWALERQRLWGYHSRS